MQGSGRRGFLESNPMTTDLKKRIAVTHECEQINAGLNEALSHLTDREVRQYLAYSLHGTPLATLMPPMYVDGMAKVTLIREYERRFGLQPTDESEWWHERRNIELTARYLADERDADASCIVQLITKPWNWEEAYQAARVWSAGIQEGF